MRYRKGTGRKTVSLPCRNLNQPMDHSGGCKPLEVSYYAFPYLYLYGLIDAGNADFPVIGDAACRPDNMFQL